MSQEMIIVIIVIVHARMHSCVHVLMGMYVCVCVENSTGDICLRKRRPEHLFSWCCWHGLAAELWMESCCAAECMTADCRVYFFSFASLKWNVGHFGAVFGR